jgi:hypothetical protein
MAETHPSAKLKMKQGKVRDFDLESRKHLLLLVIKLLHELQHLATSLLFGLFPAIAPSQHTKMLPVPQGQFHPCFQTTCCLVVFGGLNLRQRRGNGCWNPIPTGTVE